MAKQVRVEYQKHYPVYKEHIDKLVRAFPDLFNKDRPKILPLFIHDTLINYVSMSDSELNSVLYIWTRRCEYKARMACGGMRYDTNGVAVSTITDWEVENAIKWVCRFHKKATIEVAQGILDEFMTESGYEIWNKTNGTKKTPYKIQ